MNKILTIAVPTYNMEAMLPRCLDSFILSKEYMDLVEIIVVNDGSKDRSSEIAHQYAKKYPSTIFVVDKPNGNYGSCINAALKIASGKYFRICDSDDHYDNGNLSGFIDYLLETDADIVFSPYETRYFNNDIAEAIFCDDDMCGKVIDINSLKWDSPEFRKFRAMHCMATKRELLIRNKYYQTEGISYTDTQFVFYSCLYAETCSFYKKTLYIYYLGRDGQTMSKASLIKSHMHLYDNVAKMLPDYVQNVHNLSENKSRLLELSIATCMSLFANIVVCYKLKKEGDIDKIRSVISSIDNANRNNCVESEMMKTLPYKLWRKYHIPAIFLCFMAKIKSMVKRG